MKISMEVGVIAFMRYHNMINSSKLLIFLADPAISESKIFFGQGAESAESAASWPAG